MASRYLSYNKLSVPRHHPKNPRTFKTVIYYCVTVHKKMSVKLLQVKNTLDQCCGSKTVSTR